jgi:hypothetical protein
MADALTLVLLISMILAPFGLLAALASRCVPNNTPTARLPGQVSANHNYTGQPIR